MAIFRLLENSALGLGPKEVNCIIEAYEQALRTLCVKDRDDPLTEMIAKKIIKIAQTGVHDAAAFGCGDQRARGPVRRPQWRARLLRCGLSARFGPSSASELSRNALVGYRLEQEQFAML